MPKKLERPQQVVVVDWFHILWDLVHNGYLLTDVSKLTDIAINTIYMYRDGSQPNHWRGERLLGLWCDVTGKHRTEAPTVHLSMMPRVVHRVEDVRPWQDAVDGLSAITKNWTGR